MIFAALVVFLVNVVVSLRRGAPPARTRGAPRRSSGRPPRRRRPTTSSRSRRSRGREPLWHSRAVAAGRSSACARDERRGAGDLPARRRAGSSLQDAGAVALAASDAIATIGHVRLVHLSGEGLVWGADPDFVCLVGWFWPTGGKERLERAALGVSPCGEPVMSDAARGCRARRQRAADLCLRTSQPDVVGARCA